MGSQIRSRESSGELTPPPAAWLAFIDHWRWSLHSHCAARNRVGQGIHLQWRPPVDRQAQSLTREYTATDRHGVRRLKGMRLLSTRRTTDPPTITTASSWADAQHIRAPLAHACYGSLHLLYTPSSRPAISLQTPACSHLPESFPAVRSLGQFWRSRATARR